MANFYKDGTHAVRNALACLTAIRDRGELASGGEQTGNYAHVCDAIEWLKNHPQAVEVVRAGPPTPRPVAGTMPAHDSPPVTTGAPACTVTPPPIPLLDSEDPNTIAEMIIGAFRIFRNDAGDGHGFVVRRWRPAVPGHTPAGWSSALTECSADLWPWRLFGSIKDAENAILAHGRATGEPVTLVRNDGAEIVTAHPNYDFPRSTTTPGSSSTDYRYWTPPTDSDGKEIPVGPDFIYFRLCRDEQHGYFFDRWYPDHNGRWRWFQCNMAPDRDIHRELNHGAYTIEGALEKWKTFRENKAVYLVSSKYQPDGETVWERHNVTPVTLAADTNIPEHDGTFRIMPNVLKPDDGWSIRQWDNKKWASLSLLGTFPDYWSAVDRVKEAARLRSEATYLVTPSEREIEYWAGAGFTIKAPPAPGVFSPFYNPAMVEPITTAAQEILEIIKDGAARELKIPPVPAPEIGTKIPVPLESGFWAIDEWTATGWNRVADDLDWEEVEDKLRPAAAAPAYVITPGTCEIRPGSMPGDIWDVFQWTGRSWKEIAGNVTKRTAEGVVRARAMDPENPVATPLAGTVVKSYRRIVKAVRSDLVSLDGDIRSWLASPSPTMAPDELLKQISNQINGIMKSIEDGISVHA